MNIDIKNISDGFNAKNVNNLRTSKNNKSHQIYKNKGNNDSVKTSAISKILSKQLQQFKTESGVRKEKIESFKTLASEDNHFSDSVIDKIFSNIIGL
jgi:glycyl-tRNA synthetase (class II)